MLVVDRAYPDGRRTDRDHAWTDAGADSYGVDVEFEAEWVEGDVLVLNRRPIDGRIEVGGLFYPENEDVERSLMVLMAGIEVSSLPEIEPVVGADGFTLAIDEAYRPALTELEGFSHINVLWWADQVDDPMLREVTIAERPYRDAPAAIGTTIELCATSAAGCHGCLLVSADPGPTQIGSILVPIGLPLLATIVFPVFPQAPICAPLTIPDNPQLVGMSLYMNSAANSTVRRISSWK